MVDEVAYIREPPKDFFDLIKLVAEEIREETGRETDGAYVFNVTELVECPKKAYMYRVVPEDQWKVNIVDRIYSSYYTRLGSLIHDVLQALIAGRSEVGVADEWEYKGAKITVKGRADIVLRDAVIEIKSTRVENVKKHGIWLPHLLQLAWYMKMLGKGKGFLLYFDRAEPRILVVYVTPDSYRGPVAFHEFLNIVQQDIRKRAEQIVDWLRDATPPENIVGVRAAWCRWCPFRKMCGARKEPRYSLYASVTFKTVKEYRGAVEW